MAYKTTEECVNAVAKYLIKRFKESEEKRLVSITDHFTNTRYDSSPDVHLVFHGDKDIDFGVLSNDEFGSVTCKIADVVCAKLKVKKNAIVYRDESRETVHHGTWYSRWDSHYTITKRIIVVYPCKEFIAINKKLKALGLKEINFKEWYYCTVVGKRSSIFYRQYTYYADESAKCKKVLEYLRGKKKVAYDFVNVDDLEDRRRGEEYETEWCGSESRQIRFTDSKGKTTTIY